MNFSNLYDESFAQGAAVRAPKLLTSAGFVKDFVPPDYLIEGILQRRFLYSITGRTLEFDHTGYQALAFRVAVSLLLVRPLRAPC